MEPGSKLKHYRILSRIGEGGMGVVYRAEDTRLGRTVALKVLPAGLTGDEHRARRFEREARAASAVNHPGIATLYDFDRDGETAFLTMEFVEGKTLKAILAEGPLPPERLLNCLSQVADALAAAHRKGVIHRDLKPDNVMMATDSGFYKILDFGLARFEDPRGGATAAGDPREMETVTRDMTEAGKVLGTFAYMSPEQAQAEAIDARSDIFSFGTLLYELATGTQPFRGKNPITVFHAIVHEEPEPLRGLAPELPEDLDRIAARCLAKDREDRYPTADVLAGELRLLRRASDHSGSGIAAGVAPRPRRLPRRWLVALAVALGAAALALPFWILRGTTPSAPDTAPVAGAPPGAAVETSRDRILVTFFANRSGDPEADWLVRGVPEMLSTDLARTDELEVISTQRIYDLLASTGRTEAELDGETAAQLARWAGAGVVVSGAVYRPGDTYRIDLQAHDTATGKVLTANRVEGGDLFQMVDKLATDLRAGLQITTAKGAGITDVTTASPEAYRSYSRGLDRYQELDFEAAGAAFREAIERDSDFALARLRLGMSLLLSGDAEGGQRWISRAARAGDRMPERERLLAEGILAYFVEGNPETAVAALDTVIERYPKDLEARFWRAQGLAAVASEHSAAFQTLHEMLEIDPNDPLANAALVGLLLDLNLDSEAGTILESFVARNPRADVERIRGFVPPAAPEAR